MLPLRSPISFANEIIELLLPHADTDTPASTDKTVAHAPTPKITVAERFAQAGRLLLRIVGASLGVIALILGAQWYLQPETRDLTVNTDEAYTRQSR